MTAPYKYPREIEFVDELPKTVSGKIRRVELRQREIDRATEPVREHRRLPLRGVPGYHLAAGWSSPVARWAHNPEVTGSNPVPATKTEGSRRGGAPSPYPEPACARTMLPDRSRSRGRQDMTAELRPSVKTPIPGPESDRLLQARAGHPHGDRPRPTARASSRSSRGTATAGSSRTSTATATSTGWRAGRRRRSAATTPSSSRPRTGAQGVRHRVPLVAHDLAPVSSSPRSSSRSRPSRSARSSTTPPAARSSRTPCASCARPPAPAARSSSPSWAASTAATTAPAPWARTTPTTTTASSRS